MMIMIKKVIDYIKEPELSFKYINNTLNIVNYDKIINLDDNSIILEKNSKLLTIKGEKLVLNKLLEQEILVTGMIKSIEM